MPDEAANSRLLFLVHQATLGDPDAGRVVIARILPGLITLAARSRGPFDPAFDDCLSGAWLVTAGYPVARRPVKVAGNLLYDTEHLVRGPAPAAERATVPVPPRDLPALVARLDGRRAGAPDEPLITLLGVLRDARAAGLSDTSFTILTDLGIRGWDPENLGPHDGVTDRAVRWRRTRALRELRRRLDRDPDTGRQPTAPDGWIPTDGGTARRRAA